MNSSLKIIAVFFCNLLPAVFVILENQRRVIICTTFIFRSQCGTKQTDTLVEVLVYRFLD